MTQLTYEAQKECEVCKDPAIVGYGSPPKWLCQNDFNQALRKTRAAIETARRLTPVRGTT